MSVIRFILLTMIGLDLYWWWFADQRVRSLRRPRLWRTLVAAFILAIPDLPPNLSGLTIAHLSDFHAGRFMTPAMMRPIIDDVNDMKPDLVFVTGDLIDYALIDLPPAIDEIRRLKPTLGFNDGV